MELANPSSLMCLYMWTFAFVLYLLCYALFSHLVPMPHTTPHTHVMQSSATHGSLRNGAPSGSSGRRLTKSAATLLRGGVAPSGRISLSRSMGWNRFYHILSVVLFLFQLFAYRPSTSTECIHTLHISLHVVSCHNCIKPQVLFFLQLLMAWNDSTCTNTAYARKLVSLVDLWLLTDKGTKTPLHCCYPIVALKKESHLALQPSHFFAGRVQHVCANLIASVFKKLQSHPKPRSFGSW